MKSFDHTYYWLILVQTTFIVDINFIKYNNKKGFRSRPWRGKLRQPARAGTLMGLYMVRGILCFLQIFKLEELEYLRKTQHGIWVLDAI